MNIRSFRKTIVIGFMVFLLVVLAACSGNNSNGEATATATPSSKASETIAASEESLPQVELIWYYGQPKAQSDLSSVQEAVNKITLDKINATVVLKPIDFGEYTDKMNTIAASGEVFDLIWTANWNFNFEQNVAKGVFLAMDELLANYGAEVKQSLPDYMWDSTTIGGKIYGVPNYQSMTGREGYMLPQEYVDKYKVDLAAIQKFEDIEPLLAQIKQAEPDKIPLVMRDAGMFGYFLYSQGLSIVPMTSTIPPIAFYSKDESLKLINTYETPEYKHYLEVVRQWYQKGYINHDAPTLDVAGPLELTKTGKAIVYYSAGLNPGVEITMKNRQYGGKDVAIAPVTDFIIANPNPGVSTVNAISRTAKNPERAMMLLNLVNTDKDLFNLLAFGVEGKHYTKVADNTIKINAEGGYSGNSGWVMGNTFNGYLQEGQAADTFEVAKKINAEATPTLITGFKFDPSLVATEIANVQTVLDEYLPGLNTGAIDYDKHLPVFLEKLKQAGNEKILQEAQKQLDAWKQLK